MAQPKAPPARADLATDNTAQPKALPSNPPAQAVSATDDAAQGTAQALSAAGDGATNSLTPPAD
eukprot:11227603-Lingulodinium_polyedra.AAC.1